MTTNLLTHAMGSARRLLLLSVFSVASLLLIAPGSSEAAPRARQVIVSAAVSNQVYGLGMTADGRYVLYSHSAGSEHVLRLVDNQTGDDTIIVTRPIGNAPVTPVIAPGGETVAYLSGGGITFYEIASGEFEPFEQIETNATHPFLLRLVDDGNVAVIADDGTPSEGFILFDRRTGEQETLPVPSGICDEAAVEAGCITRILERSVSANGRFFVFEEQRYCGELDPDPGCETTRGIFVFDRDDGSLTPLDFEGNAPGSFSLEISDDGSTVRYECVLVDVATGETTTFAVLPDGTVYESCTNHRMTPDARYVSFSPPYDPQTSEEVGQQPGLFVRDVETGETRLASLPVTDEALFDNAYNPFLSDDGQRITFTSRAANLVGDDGDGNEDIFVTTWYAYSLIAPGAAHQLQ